MFHLELAYDAVQSNLVDTAVVLKKFFGVFP